MRQSYKAWHFSARKWAFQGIFAIYGNGTRLPAPILGANLCIALFLALKCQALQLRRIRGGAFYTRINTIFSRFAIFFFGLFCFIL
jgi:hypothetical protein